MFKSVLFLALLVLGVSSKHLAKNADEEWSEEDVRAVIHLVFCTCDDVERDGSLSLEEFTGEVCEVVNDHLFGYQVNADDFNAMDENQDGLISHDEVFDALKAMKRKVPDIRGYFSNNVHVEAAVRIFGCACDEDESWTVSYEETQGEFCVGVQQWVSGGHHMDQEAFEYVDSNNDGEIDGQEITSTLEQLFESYQNETRNDEDWSEEDVRAVIHLVFCTCDDIERDGSLSLDEFTGEVCEVVNDHLFGYQVNADDFNAMDENQDGLISHDEVFDALKAMKRNVSIRDFYFSNNVHVEAGVRIFGCACDEDESWSISYEETQSEFCVGVQQWVCGHNMDQEAFEYVDSNNDGEIDGQEAATALEQLFESYQEAA